LLEVREFQVDVVDNNVKHTFTAHTDMEWHVFSEETHRYIASPCSEVLLGFRLSGNTGAMSYIRSEEDWARAVVQLGHFQHDCARKKASKAQAQGLFYHKG